MKVVESAVHSASLFTNKARQLVKSQSHAQRSIPPRAVFLQPSLSLLPIVILMICTFYPLKLGRTRSNYIGSLEIL